MSNQLNILIIGSGGREHAIGWKVRQSPRCGKLYFAPGNGGTQQIGENLNCKVNDFAKLVLLAKEKQIDVVIVGPEAPLEAGIVDLFRMSKIPIVGPTKAAAQLETSKAFAKSLMNKVKVPTAGSMIFDNPGLARSWLLHNPGPRFVKASGLAAGKGAIPCISSEEAARAVHEIMEKRIFDDAGNQIVVEEWIQGIEISIHAFVEGAKYEVAPTTQDNKRLLPDGQTLPNGTNPNTGGMGAVGPVPTVDPSQVFAIRREIIEPTIDEMVDRGFPFSGILYPGLMMTSSGPKVLEFNVRGGDPETQVLMRLLKSDAVDLFEMLAKATLGEKKVEWHDDLCAVCVVVASGGYPGKIEKGYNIAGIEVATRIPEVEIFHAGTRYDDGEYYTDGGRVLGVTAVGKTFQAATGRAYQAIRCMSFPGMYYRQDIGGQYP